MRIAVACKGDEIGEDLASCAEFAIFESENGSIRRSFRRTVPAGEASQKVNLLVKNDADILLCGRVSREWGELLRDAGVLYIGGLSGGARMTAERYLEGTLPF